MPYFTLWHFAYALETFSLLDRYKNHLNKSEIHTKEYLRRWYLAHLLGKFPRKEFNTEELLQEYAKQRGVEFKDLKKAFQLIQ